MPAQLDRQITEIPQWAVSLPALLSRPRVLLISDDPAVSSPIGRSLRLDGCEVWAASSASEGLALARAHSPGVVVVNLRMPLPDGLALLRQLRGVAPQADVPIAIVTSGHAPEDDAAAEVEALGAQIWYRPLWVQELLVLTRELARAEVRN